MAIERHDESPRRGGFSLPAMVAIGALAIFGAITAAQWLLGTLLGFIRLGLVIVVVIAVGAWVVSAKGDR